MPPPSFFFYIHAELTMIQLGCVKFPYTICTVRYCAFLQYLEALTIAIVCPVGYGLDSRSFIEFFWNLKKKRQTAINLLSRREKTMRQRRTFDRKSPFNYQTIDEMKAMIRNKELVSLSSFHSGWSCVCVSHTIITFPWHFFQLVSKLSDIICI